MSVSFTKLASSITDSTLWAEPDRTRLVWITMLAMVDQFGRVHASVPGLANRARVPVEDTRIALSAFLSPDLDSRTKDFEGRRIEAIDGGWRLLNHAKYRDLRAADDRKEQNRQAQARLRAKRKADTSAKVSTRQHQSGGSAHTDADTDTDARDLSSPSGTRRQPSASDVPACPYSVLIDSYHQALPELPKVRLPDKKHPALLKAWQWCFKSFRQDGSRRVVTLEQGVAWFRAYFERARQNDFLMGRAPRGAGHENWSCDLDFLLTDKGLTQVIEKTELAAA